MQIRVVGSVGATCTFSDDVAALACLAPSSFCFFLWTISFGCLLLVFLLLAALECFAMVVRKEPTGRRQERNVNKKKHLSRANETFGGCDRVTGWILIHFNDVIQLRTNNPSPLLVWSKTHHLSIQESGIVELHDKRKQ